MAKFNYMVHMSIQFYEGENRILCNKMSIGIKVFKFADLMCFKIASFYHHSIEKNQTHLGINIWNREWQHEASFSISECMGNKWM